MFGMLLYVLLLLFSIVAAQERAKYCTPPKSPLPLPDCTRQCLIGEFMVLDGTCADDLVGFCRLYDVVPIHFSEYGPCLLNACPSLTDRQDYVNMFFAACEGFNVNFTSLERDFTYEDLLRGTPSGSFGTITLSPPTTDGGMTSTRSGGDTPNPITDASATDAQSKTSSTSTSTDKRKSSDSSSEPPPSATSTLQSSTNKEEPTSAVAAPLPNGTDLAQSTSEGQNGVTVHPHVTVAATSTGAPESTATATAAPAFSTTAIAGTAAGGTVGIALIIGLIFFLMRRHKRRSSLASSADIWEPNHNIGPKPKLPNVDNDSSFGRYSEVGAGAPMRQRSKAELHSEDIPPPRPQTGYPRPPDMRAGGSGENARYYQPAQRPEPHRHGSNMDSRYPEMGSHAAPSMSSPTLPVVSQTSTMQGWHANSPSGAPTISLSNADLRSEGMRSPVSELGTNAPLRSTRSAELYSAGAMSPMSELSSDSFMGSGHGAAELHNEPLAPPQLEPRVGETAPDGVVEMEGSNMHKAHRPGVSTKF